MTPNLSEAFGAVAPRIEEVARSLSEHLTSQGVPHALVGGLAVGSYGYPRATTDVDAILPTSLFSARPGGIVILPPGLPASRGGVRIDYVLIKKQYDSLIDEALDAAPVSAEGIPVIGVEALIMMKLIAGRAKDRGDVVELLKHNGPKLYRSTVDYLKPRVPEFLSLFDEWAYQAKQESLNGE